MHIARTLLAHYTLYIVYGAQKDMYTLHVHVQWTLQVSACTTAQPGPPKLPILLCIGIPLPSMLSAVQQSSPFFLQTPLPYHIS